MMEKSPSPAEKGVGAVILSSPSKLYAAFGVPWRSVAVSAPLTSPCRVPAESSALPSTARAKKPPFRAVKRPYKSPIQNGVS
jgi:hypothetical protein